MDGRCVTDIIRFVDENDFIILFGYEGKGDMVLPKDKIASFFVKG